MKLININYLSRRKQNPTKWFVWSALGSEITAFTGIVKISCCVHSPTRTGCPMGPFSCTAQPDRSKPWHVLSNQNKAFADTIQWDAQPERSKPWHVLSNQNKAFADLSNQILLMHSPTWQIKALTCIVQSEQSLCRHWPIRSFSCTAQPDRSKPWHVLSNQNKAFADTDQSDPSHAQPNLTDQSLDM